MRSRQVHVDGIGKRPIQLTLLYRLFSTNLLLLGLLILLILPSLLFFPSVIGEQENSMESALAFIRTHSQASPVVIFSKSYCPFCKKAKEIFHSHNQKFRAFELDQIENGDTIQKALKEMTGQSTVPNIFIHGNHIGGCNDVDIMNQKGELVRVLGSKHEKEEL